MEDIIRALEDWDDDVRSIYLSVRSTLCKKTLQHNDETLQILAPGMVGPSPAYRMRQVSELLDMLLGMIQTAHGGGGHAEDLTESTGGQGETSGVGSRSPPDGMAGPSLWHILLHEVIQRQYILVGRVTDQSQLTLQGPR